MLATTCPKPFVAHLTLPPAGVVAALAVWLKKRRHAAAVSVAAASSKVGPASLESGSKSSSVPPAISPTLRHERRLDLLASDPMLSLLLGGGSRMGGTKAAGSGGSSWPSSGAIVGDLEPWAVDFEELELERAIGAGSFGKASCSCVCCLLILARGREAGG